MRISMVAMGPEDMYRFEELVSASLLRIIDSLRALDALNKAVPVEIYIGKRSSALDEVQICVRTFLENGRSSGESKPSSIFGSYIPNIQGFGESDIVQILVKRLQQHLMMFFGGPVGYGQQGRGYYLCNEPRRNQLQ